MVAVGLALCSAALFGAMTVYLRSALGRVPDPVAGAFVATMVGTALFGIAVVARSQYDGKVWPFMLAGLLAPGASQILFMLGVQTAGAARVSVVVGSAPLVAVTIALVFLDEPFHVALLAGAVLVVIGSLALAREPDRPEHFRAAGIALAFACTVFFATRDNLFRWLATDTEVAPMLAAAATVGAGAALIAVYLLVTASPRTLPGRLRRAAPAFAGPGVVGALSYAALLEAYYRGRVSVVSPLVATESLWGVLIAALVLRRTELVGRHLVAGALLVVAGGVLIGAFR